VPYSGVECILCHDKKCKVHNTRVFPQKIFFFAATMTKVTQLSRIEKDEQENKKKVSKVPKEKVANKKKRVAAINGPGENSLKVERYSRRDYSGIQKKSIREMAYSKEVERLSEDTYQHIANDLLDFTKRLSDLTGTIARYDNRCTVSARDVRLALTFMGKKVYF
jgi:histone H3/H4